MTEILAQISQTVATLGVAAYVGVALWLLARARPHLLGLMPAPHWLVLAAAAMAGWSAALATWPSGSAPVLVVQALRDAVLLGWLAATFWSAPAPLSPQLRLILRLLWTLCAIMLLFGGTALLFGPARAAGWLDSPLAIGTMIVAIGALLLTDSGVRKGHEELRAPLMTVAGGFAMLWAYELNMQLIEALTGQPAATLRALVPAVALLIVPTMVIAAADVGRERIRLSRAAAMRALLLVGAAAYLVLIGLAGAIARLVGGDHGELAQGLFLIVAAGAGGLLFLSARARAWLAVTVSKHIFEHRYDYRAEWMRFTATLAEGNAESDGRDLYRRVAKGLAELTGSPAAMLMLPDVGGTFRPAECWRWDGATEHADASLSLRSAFMLQERQYIVDLDAERAQAAASDFAVPDWLLAERRAWVMVPLLHFQRLIAVVILHRPPVSRALDWEDLDVLRIAGRQAASYLAEAQGQQALSEAKRFDEFNRRFAFIMHDIKNLTSQLALLARNAERHADKPAFRADMVETLKSSAGRLSDLLARLSARERSRNVEAGRVAIEPLLLSLATQVRARHSVAVSCHPGLAAWGNDDDIRQILRHLVDNAIEASAPDGAVQFVATEEADRVRIDVIDEGKGMTRAFIRDELFKPFVSTKANGFGLGAFEALQLAEAMGGSLQVKSEPDLGTRFTLRLPASVGSTHDMPSVRFAKAGNQ